jgi:hypothetical protein
MRSMATVWGLKVRNSDDALLFSLVRASPSPSFPIFNNFSAELFATSIAAYSTAHCLVTYS